jgi:hypothetical protein
MSNNERPPRIEIAHPPPLRGFANFERFAKAIRDNIEMDEVVCVALVLEFREALHTVDGLLARDDSERARAYLAKLKAIADGFLRARACPELEGCFSCRSRCRGGRSCPSA